MSNLILLIIIFIISLIVYKKYRLVNKDIINKEKILINSNKLILDSNSIVDYNKLFEISDDLKINKITIGNSKTNIFYVDNFFKNPFKIRDFALELKYSNNDFLVSNFPGYRCSLIFGLDKIKNKIYNIVNKSNKFKLKIPNTQLFNNNIKFNRFNNNYELFFNELNLNPHIDSIPKLYNYNRNLATILYLNKEKECHGGTAFYRHKKTGTEIVNKWEDYSSIINNITNNYDYYINDSNQDWEMIKKIDMKFNRMVIYPLNLFHSAYIKKNTFKDYDRLTQTLFI